MKFSYDKGAEKFPDAEDALRKLLRLDGGPDLIEDMCIANFDDGAQLQRVKAEMKDQRHLHRIVEEDRVGIFVNAWEEYSASKRWK